MPSERPRDQAASSGPEGAAGSREVRLLFLGDIVGRPGREAVARWLPALRRREKVDFVIANGENLAGGFGLTEQAARAVFEAGVDCLTSGNHIWHRRDSLPFLERESRLLRPANYPPGAPGAGSGCYALPRGSRVGVLNLQGRTFMLPIDCPFRAARALVDELRASTPLVLVDFHAEATSEKVALGWYLDGAATAVVGTHTHVQTADERVLPQGTAYITDAGFTGSFDSVIGMEKGAAIQRFLDQRPARYQVAHDDLRLQGVLVRADAGTGRGLEIRRIEEREERRGKEIPR
jgi:metallophosphoesterase (TIGR00282 family)